MIKYFIRINQDNVIEFELYLHNKNIKFMQLSTDFEKHKITTCFSVSISREDALVLKLVIPSVAMMMQPT